MISEIFFSVLYQSTNTEEKALGGGGGGRGKGTSITFPITKIQKNHFQRHTSCIPRITFLTQLLVLHISFNGLFTMDKNLEVRMVTFD